MLNDHGDDDDDDGIKGSLEDGLYESVAVVSVEVLDKGDGVTAEGRGPWIGSLAWIHMCAEGKLEAQFFSWCTRALPPRSTGVKV